MIKSLVNKRASRIAIAFAVTAAIAASLWFSVPAQAITITFSPTPLSSGTLGSTYSFTVQVDVENTDLLPIDHIDFEIYNTSQPATYRFTCTNLPIPTGAGATEAKNYTPTGAGTVSVSATTAGGWGGASGTLRYGFGYVSDIVDENGVFTEAVTAQSEDENVSITIEEGITGLTAEGEPLSEISITEMAEADVPPPPDDGHVIGLTYNIGPTGATFSEPVTITLSYNPDELPEGVNEEDLVIARWDEDAGEWVKLPSVVDTENNTVTATVDHFTIFAIIVPPPPEPAAFSVSYLSVSPRLEVEPGETVAIAVLVANTGGESGSYTTVLKINGVKEAEKTVTVAAGESRDVTFSVTKEEAGSYTVAVDGLSGSFTVIPVVVPPVKPISWWVWLAVGLASAAVAGLLVYFLWWRRRFV